MVGRHLNFVDGLHNVEENTRFTSEDGDWVFFDAGDVVIYVNLNIIHIIFIYNFMDNFSLNIHVISSSIDTLWVNFNCGFCLQHIVYCVFIEGMTNFIRLSIPSSPSHLLFLENTPLVIIYGATCGEDIFIFMNPSDSFFNTRSGLWQELISEIVVNISF